MGKKGISIGVSILIWGLFLGGCGLEGNHSRAVKAQQNSSELKDQSVVEVKKPTKTELASATKRLEPVLTENLGIIFGGIHSKEDLVKYEDKVKLDNPLFYEDLGQNSDRNKFSDFADRFSVLIGDQVAKEGEGSGTEGAVFQYQENQGTKYSYDKELTKQTEILPDGRKKDIYLITGQAYTVFKRVDAKGNNILMRASLAFTYSVKENRLLSLNVVKFEHT